MVTGIIVAAGRGTRMGETENKVFLRIKEQTVLEYTVKVFEACSDIDNIVVVIGNEDMKKCQKLLLGIKKEITFVVGGGMRRESVYNGILAAKGEIVVIHDGARALILPEFISATIEECKKFGAATLGVTAKDTIKLVDKQGFIEKTLNREYSYQIQTPQTFRRDLILKAHEQEIGMTVTDDCALAESCGIPIKVVPGSYENIKLTTPEDMIIAEKIIENRQR